MEVISVSAGRSISAPWCWLSSHLLFYVLGLSHGGVGRPGTRLSGFGSVHLRCGKRGFMGAAEGWGAASRLLAWPCSPRSSPALHSCLNSQGCGSGPAGLMQVPSTLLRSQSCSGCRSPRGHAFSFHCVAALVPVPLCWHIEARSPARSGCGSRRRLGGSWPGALQVSSTPAHVSWALGLACDPWPSPVLQ